MRKINIINKYNNEYIILYLLRDKYYKSKFIKLSYTWLSGGSS